MIVVVIVFLLLLVLTAILAGLETGLYSLERVRLEVSAARGDGSASRLLSLLASPASTVAAILVATNLVQYVLAYSSDRLVAEVAPGDVFTGKLLNTLFLAPVLFVFGDLFPKNLFMRAPGSLMRTFEPIASLVRAVFRPLAFPLVKLAERIGPKRTGVEPASIFDRGTIHYMLTVDEESANLTDAQRTLAERVLALRSLRVQDRMVPLGRTSAVGPEATAGEIVAEAARSGHSRLPVFAPGGTRFAGYVNVIDAATAGGAFAVAENLHQLPAVPCDLPVTTALYRLQRAGRPIAEVVSPDGRATLGIIAVSDIVSALFRV